MLLILCIWTFFWTLSEYLILRSYFDSHHNTSPLQLNEASIKPRPNKDTLDPTITGIVPANLFFGLNHQKVIKEIAEHLGRQYNPSANFGNNKVVIYFVRSESLDVDEMYLIGGNRTAGMQLDVTPNFGPDSSQYLYEKPELGNTINVIISIVRPNEQEIIDLVVAAIKGSLPQIYDRSYYQYEKKQGERFKRYIEHEPILWALEGLSQDRPLLLTKMEYHDILVNHENAHK